MAFKQYKDKARDHETLMAVRERRAAMEHVEWMCFKEGTATMEDVDRVRDEYWDVWEQRRNFVLGEKYGKEIPTRSRRRAA